MSRIVSTRATLNNEMYSQSSTSKRVQTALQASGSEKYLLSGALSQRTNLAKGVKTQRSQASSSSSKYLTKLSSARNLGVPYQEQATSSKVVIYADGQAQGHNTPSYMQPIQSKFKKQTIRMVQEKETSFYIPTQTEIIARQQKLQVLASSHDSQ